MKHLNLLIEIFKKTQYNGLVKITTTKFSKTVGCSQQTLSRKLISLEQDMYINRIVHHTGIEIALTPRGIDELRLLGKLLTLGNE